jgi:hypothetical protein
MTLEATWPGSRLGANSLGPLIVCVDRLHESRPPGDADWPVQVVQPPDLLPEGLYLVLTSRPLDDPTARPALSGQLSATGATADGAGSGKTCCQSCCMDTSNQPLPAASSRPRSSRPMWLSRS